MFIFVTDSDETDSCARSELLSDIRAEFGPRLDPDMILANCAYEWVLKWSESSDNYAFLTLSVECFDAVASCSLCANAQSFVWSMFVCETFTNAAMLLERTGCRVPRDRVVKRELNMEMRELELFLEFVRVFLALLLRRIGEEEADGSEDCALRRKKEEARYYFFPS